MDVHFASTIPAFRQCLRSRCLAIGHMLHSTIVIIALTFLLQFTKMKSYDNYLTVVPHYAALTESVRISLVLYVHTWNICLKIWQELQNSLSCVLSTAKGAMCRRFD
jgi:hypothetical protein